ncbi:hypothetical protein, partial [Salmonella sp. s54836]|uniref:hypothetical protein n=1 Tax=Salmonella sp. s54836 TaxID=3159673 RepID=UPI0039803919
DSPQLSLFYYNASLNPPASSIKWQINIEEDENVFNNPIPLNKLYERIGRVLRIMLLCYSTQNGRSLGTATLSIRDSAILTVSYKDAVFHYTDVSNAMFPFP